MSNPGYVAFRLATEISPIILTGGIASSIGAIPIVALTEGPNFVSELLSGGDSISLDNFFAHFYALPGGTIANNQVATYPLANQAVAANAIIAQPLNVSIMMECPARGNFGYPLKLATMIALQKTLEQHNNSGGLYSVVTPWYIYTNCIMTGMRDVSSGETKQGGHAWQIDFLQPLVTQSAANTALNSLMRKLQSGVPISGAPSWSSGLPIGNPSAILTESLSPGSLA